MQGPPADITPPCPSSPRWLLQAPRQADGHPLTLHRAAQSPWDSVSRVTVTLPMCGYSAAPPTGLRHTASDTVFNGQLSHWAEQQTDLQVLWAGGGHQSAPAPNQLEPALGPRCVGSLPLTGSLGTQRVRVAQLRAGRLGTAPLQSCPSWPYGPSQGGAWGWLAQALRSPSHTPSGSSEAPAGLAGGPPAVRTETHRVSTPGLAHLWPAW